MSNKKAVEYFCQSCHGEFMITWEEVYNDDEPKYCPFCSDPLEDALDYTEDDDI